MIDSFNIENYRDYCKELSKWSAEKTQENEVTNTKFRALYYEYLADFVVKKGKLVTIFNAGKYENTVRNLGYRTDDDIWKIFSFFAYADMYNKLPKLPELESECKALIAVGYEINKQVKLAY